MWCRPYDKTKPDVMKVLCMGYTSSFVISHCLAFHSSSNVSSLEIGVWQCQVWNMLVPVTLIAKVLS